MESGPGKRDTVRGLGLAASLPDDVVRHAAEAVQREGYHSFWLNNPPRANALATLGAVSRHVHVIRLGVGVIPLSHHRPEQIVQEIRDHQVPLDRLYLGIGSGAGSGGVQRVSEGVRVLRESLDCTLVVAALGPRMCRLAGAHADGVLLNWLTPDFARRSIELIAAAAHDAGRRVPRIMAYVRVALGAVARERLEREARGYEQNAHYAAHFARMGVDARGTAIEGDSSRELQENLSAWDGVVDELVVRAITASDDARDVLALVEAAHP